MTKGFYNLTSGILSQTRRLDVVGNNMTNITTAGYKTELYTDITFEEVLINSAGNKYPNDGNEIGSQSYALVPDLLYYDHTQGSIDETGLNLDFAITGEGYFQIQTEDGVQYTRGGSFSLDNEGYLYLPRFGRVLGENGAPIQLATDDIRADGAGNIYNGQTGALMGTIGLVSFDDVSLLDKQNSGLFAQGTATTQAVENPLLYWRAVEGANVDMAGEMAKMLTAQRALQSSSQILKLYDELLTKSTTEIARL